MIDLLSDKDLPCPGSDWAWFFLSNIKILRWILLKITQNYLELDAHIRKSESTIEFIENHKTKIGAGWKFRLIQP